MDIRLVASDVDGTILPRGGVISPRTAAAVARCVARGVPYVIASGRWYVSAKVIADALRMDRGVMIIANGGAVVDLRGRPMAEWTMSRARAEGAWRILSGEDVMINAFARNAVYRIRTDALKEPPKGLGDYLGGRYWMVNDDEARFAECGLESPYKLEAYGDDPRALLRLKARLEAEGYAVTSAYRTNIEIMEAGCGKGRALDWLGARWGIPRERRMAFGDNLNDLDLLQASGWPVAMGNAVPALKAAAWRTAPPCEEDGEAQMLEEWMEGRLT